MSIFTRLLLLLTVLALLPLGSFSAKLGTGTRHVAVISTQLNDAVALATPAEKTFATVKSRCKGPALPGSPCNPALAVWPSQLTLAFDAPATALYPSAWVPMIGQTPPHPIGPPRLA